MGRSDSTPRKLAKPPSGSPLRAHTLGYYYCRVNGRMVYFGKRWGTHREALKDYKARISFLEAGEEPPDSEQAPTVRFCCNAFLTAKKRQLDAGDISDRHFADLFKTCKRLADHFGDRLVAAIKPDGWGEYRAALAKTLGATALGNELTRVRSVMKAAYDDGILDVPARFGQQFAKPPKKAVRAAQQATHAKTFTAAEVRALIDAAPPMVRAMILLAVNCGFGNGDVAGLDWPHVDLDASEVAFPRPKTGEQRRAVLWPETLAELARVKAMGRTAKHEEDAEAVFLTERRVRWVRREWDDTTKTRRETDAIAGAFTKAKAAAGIDRRGCGFYALRRAFADVADRLGDSEAVRVAMGHVPGGNDMLHTHYAKTMPRERLQAVADAVHAWLWPAEGGADG